MSTKDFTANVISATKVVPDGNFKDSKASGIWDINEALDLIKGGNWPNVANINPSAFVDVLFQTHLYNGNGGTQTITNDIDLSTKGGLVWLKSRSNAFRHFLFDTERGVKKNIYANENYAEVTSNNYLTTFNSDGFIVGDNVDLNGSNIEFVNWTFRKQPKFFDIVTYTGNGTQGKTVAHSLNSTVGMIAVKRTDAVGNWAVYHRGANGGTDPEDYHAGFNLTDEFANNAGYWNDTAPTTTQFTLGDDNNTNANNGTFVAYLFAHNNDDGGFGEPGDQDIIKCGSYTGNGNATGTVVNLGFEPQWLLVKRADSADAWHIVDNMRGFTADGVIASNLRPNNTDAEGSATRVKPTSTGFQLVTTDNEFNANNGTYIYMAIRRGGMQTPSAASDVFAIDTQSQSSAPYAISNFPVDMALRKDTDGSSTDVHARLTQGRGMFASSTAAEGDDNIAQFDYQNGYMDNTSQDSTKFAWMWKRARGYFDVSTYIGDGATNHNVSHNLGVSPEMIWIKNRGDSTNWVVWHKNLSSGKYLRLETTAAELNQSGILGTASVGATTFPVGSNSDNTNKSSNNYISYLFATVAGVSKVGTYSGTGSSQNIDCGFTAGSSFVLVKRYDGTDSWYIADSTRGISSGQTDKIIKLNSTDAEFTESDNSADYIAPHASGFNLPASSPFNGNGDDFIFYAIAAIS